jgi:hypothetical protein
VAGRFSHGNQYRCTAGGGGVVLIAVVRSMYYPGWVFVENVSFVVAGSVVKYSSLVATLASSSSQLRWDFLPSSPPPGRGAGRAMGMCMCALSFANLPPPPPPCYVYYLLRTS